MRRRTYHRSLYNPVASTREDAVEAAGNHLASMFIASTIDISIRRASTSYLLCPSLTRDLVRISIYLPDIQIITPSYSRAGSSETAATSLGVHSICLGRTSQPFQLTSGIVSAFLHPPTAFISSTLRLSPPDFTAQVSALWAPVPNTSACDLQCLRALPHQTRCFVGLSRGPPMAHPEDEDFMIFQHFISEHLHLGHTSH